MSFENPIRNTFEDAKAKIERKYQESAKEIEIKIKEAREKTYKRLEKGS